MDELKDNYKTVLEKYIVDHNEKTLYSAYTLAHNAINSDINLLDLVSSYQTAMIDILSKDPEKGEFTSFFLNCLSLLSESLAPFEMTFRGYQDTVKQLKYKNLFLEHEQTKLTHIVNRLDIGIAVLDENGTILMINSILRYYFQKYCNFNIHNGLNAFKIPKNIISNTIATCFTKFENTSFDIELTKDFFLKVVSIAVKSSEQEQHSPFSLVIEFHDVSTFIQFDKLRTSFISMVSHELRSPISAITMSIQNMITYAENLAGETRTRLENIILANATLMSELIEDLLLVSQLDEKRMTLHYESFLLINSINSVILQLEEKINFKNITIFKSGLIELSVQADKSRIEQVIRIILDNGIKYSFEKGIITINIKIFQEKAVKCVSLSIQDFGKGIKEPDLNNLFQRFFRSKDVQNIPGTGLGLVIAKELITLHKGNITVNSKYGEGSTFSIIFPLSNNNHLTENELIY
jgi:signal transduction histidine kinase